MFYYTRGLERFRWSLSNLVKSLLQLHFTLGNEHNRCLHKKIVINNNKGKLRQCVISGECSEPVALRTTQLPWSSSQVEEGWWLDWTWSVDHLIDLIIWLDWTKKKKNNSIALWSDCAYKGLWCLFPPRISALWASKQVSHWLSVNQFKWLYGRD